MKIQINLGLILLLFCFSCKSSVQKYKGLIMLSPGIFEYVTLKFENDSCSLTYLNYKNKNPILYEKGKIIAQNSLATKVSFQSTEMSIINSDGFLTFTFAEKNGSTLAFERGIVVKMAPKEKYGFENPIIETFFRKFEDKYFADVGDVNDSWIEIQEDNIYNTVKFLHKKPVKLLANNVLYAYYPNNLVSIQNKLSESSDNIVEKLIKNHYPIIEILVLNSDGFIKGNRWDNFPEIKLQQTQAEYNTGAYEDEILSYHHYFFLYNLGEFIPIKIINDNTVTIEGKVSSNLKTFFNKLINEHYSLLFPSSFDKINKIYVENDFGGTEIIQSINLLDKNKLFFTYDSSPDQDIGPWSPKVKTFVPTTVTNSWYSDFLNENRKTLDSKKGGSIGLNIVDRNLSDTVARYNDNLNSENTINESSTYTVTANKLYFFGGPNQETPRKAFLLKGDVVKILDRNNDYLYVVYRGKSGKVTKGWITIH